jgi:hypothetical protein
MPFLRNVWRYGWWCVVATKIPFLRNVWRDRKFVQTFTFKKVVVQKKGVKLVRYGNRTQKDYIEFQFELPPSIPKEQVEFITIAGSFNGWNPKDSNYHMTNTQDNRYEYVLPKSKVADHYNEFKFVINGEKWQPVPENAKNTQNGNLTLEIK